MVLKSVRFLSDEGDETGFDMSIMDRYRERIARQVRRLGEWDASTIAGGYLTLIATEDGDYIAASWHRDGDEAVVFAVQRGFVDEPPPA